MIKEKSITRWMQVGISLLLLLIVVWPASGAAKVYTNKDLERYENRPAKSEADRRPSSSELKSSRISVDFLDAEVYQVLRMLAEEAKKKDGIEIFVSPEMSGRITIKMLDVPWTSVLKEIEQKHNLTEIFLGKHTLLIYQNKL
jgi:type II secretory pathway component HofQ